MFKKRKLTFDEEIKLKRVLKDWKNAAYESSNDAIVYFIFDNDTLSLITNHPGYLLGRGGNLSKQYTNFIKQEIPKIKRIKFYDTSNKV